MGTQPSYQCDLCGGGDVSRSLVINDKELLSCKKCGLASYYPGLTEAELKKIYNDRNYFDHNYFTAQPDGEKSTHQKYMEEAARVLRSRFGRDGSVLEVGPGGGDFLKLCINMGLRYEGIDISGLAVEALRKDYGACIHEGTIETGCIRTSYHAIAAFDVLEHCLSPREWLQSAHALLKPDGLLFLSTINVRNFLYILGHLLGSIGISLPLSRLYPPFHLHYFSPGILKEYLARSGFSILEMHHENYDYWKATPRLPGQLGLRMIYIIHNITGQKTNLYIVAKRS